jgi:hypothetical protein
LTSESPQVEIFREHVLDTSADEWATAYGKVGGGLPLAELARERQAVLYLQGEIEVSQAGPIAIDIATSDAVQMWIDAEPFESAKHIKRELAAGKHTLTFRVQVGAKSDPELKVELSKPAGSAAQFVVVGGM